MPRRKKSRSQGSVSNVIQDETYSILSSASEETMITDFGESAVHLSRSWVKEKFDSLIQNLEAKKNFELRNLRLAFNLLMLEMPENLLNTAIGSDYEDLRCIFVDHINENNENTDQTFVKPTTAVKRKRSESARDLKLNYAKKRELSVSCKKRSSSVDTFKTPVNKQWLSAFTSAKKYTVSKPVQKEETGFNLKRIMKPNEEAISISGSPLIMQQNIATPTVYIPLPGGVVMNIDPKKSRGTARVPELDKKTKSQLKILCEQLNKLV